MSAVSTALAVVLSVSVLTAPGAGIALASDDVPAVIRDRLSVYKASTTPVLSHYGSKSCVPVDGNRNPADVFQAIQTGIERALR